MLRLLLLHVVGFFYDGIAQWFPFLLLHHATHGEARAQVPRPAITFAFTSNGEACEARLEINAGAANSFKVLEGWGAVAVEL